MQPRLRQALLDSLILIKHMPQILHRRRDNATAPRGANDIVQRAILPILHNSRRDGRQRPFPRLNKISRRRRVAERVRLARDRKVVHLVVHNDAGLGDDEPAAEEEVDRRGERDGHAGGVGRDDVGGAVAGWRLEMRLLERGMGVHGTYVSRDSNPVGSYEETFNVWKSEILLLTVSAVVSLSISCWYSSRPGSNNGSPRYARC